MFRVCRILVLVCIGACCTHAEPVRIMPLGDSITHGYWSGIGTNHYNSYRKTLKLLLDEGGYSIDFVGGLADGDFPDNQHHGHDGWYADHDTQTNTILSHVSGWMAETQADIVLMHIGTNDILGQNEDADEVSDILDEIYEANSNATVVLALIINAGVDDWRGDAISLYNTNLNAMAQNRIGAGDDLLIVDMEYGAGIDYASADMADTYHPSQVGYDKMATNWFPATAAAIERQRIKKQPRINSLHIEDGILVLGLGNLPASLIHIEQTASLTSSVWFNVSSMVPGSFSTNLAVSSNIVTQAFFRISVP